MRRILDETTDLIALYRHHVGKTEVPIDLHTWACIASIAACVADRVWVTKLGKKLTPALYTMLVTSSAAGKGGAVDVLTSYLEDLVPVNMYSGVITAQKLVQMMAGAKVKKRSTEGEITKEPSKIFLVTEELGWCLGNGPPAVEFIRCMTGIYNKGSKIQKATVTSGRSVIHKPSLNWFAGTTIEWLIDSLPKNAIEGGFIGRLIIVDADRSKVRHRDAIFPPDREEVIEHLKKRFRRLTEIGGEFRVTKEAREIEDQWYYSRPEPDDARLMPIWRRQHDHLLKLAMVLALSESHRELRILRRHMIAARDLVEATYGASIKILDACYTTKESGDVATVRSVIREHKIIKHSSLQRKVIVRGIDARKLAACIETLRAGHEITVHNVRGKFYLWHIRGRKSPPKKKAA